MEEWESVSECPVCGCLHNGADDICEDCLKAIDGTLRHIQTARDILINEMIYEAAGNNEFLVRVLEEGLKK